MSELDRTHTPESAEASETSPSDSRDNRQAAGPEQGAPRPTDGSAPTQEEPSPFQAVEVPTEGAAPAEVVPSAPQPGPRERPRAWRAARKGPRGSLRWVPLAFAACGGLVVLGIILVSFLVPSGRLTAISREKVGLVFIEGVIVAGRSGAGFFGGASGSDTIVSQLARARRDSSIKAVVVRINSPGGSAAASQEIYNELMKIRRAGKPVVVSMGDVAASGGYYVASAASRIVANGSTLTGSIGVLMETQNLQGLFQKIGVRSQTIKKGKFKDIGSASRPMTPEERRLLEGLVNDVYEQFVNAVIAGRKMDPATVRKLADGRVFTGRQAHALKLVDQLGNLQDALLTAARLAGIKGYPTVVELRRASFLGALMGAEPEFESDLRLPVAASNEQWWRLFREWMQRRVIFW